MMMRRIVLAFLIFWTVFMFITSCHIIRKYEHSLRVRQANDSLES